MFFTSNINANMNNRIQSRDTTWTLTTRKNEFAIVDGQYVRRLTPIECERLQGFPDDWTKGVSDTQRYKQIGNAVTVTVVESLLSHLTNQTKGFGDKK